MALLARVAAAAQEDGEPLVDLGRGNPETGPPPHVVETLSAAAVRPEAHGLDRVRPVAVEEHLGGLRVLVGVMRTVTRLSPGCRLA